MLSAMLFQIEVFEKEGPVKLPVVTVVDLPTTSFYINYDDGLDLETYYNTYH